MFDVCAHYSDSGVFPTRVLVEHIYHGNPWLFSVFLINGSCAFAAACFAVTFAAGVAMAMGLHTRLATLVVNVMVWSIHMRNPAVLNGGDTMLRLVALYLLFAPRLGDAFSVDAVLL